jgi:hypothetical protein
MTVGENPVVSTCEVGVKVPSPFSEEDGKGANTTEGGRVRLGRYGNIRDTVTVKVAHRRHREIGNGRRVDGRLKRTVSIPEQHLEGGGRRNGAGIVDHQQIGFAVLVEVGHKDVLRSGPNGEPRGGFKPLRNGALTRKGE